MRIHTDKNPVFPESQRLKNVLGSVADVKNSLRHFAIGIAGGTVLTAILVALSHYRMFFIQPIDPQGMLTFLHLFLVAIGEELIFRGYVFRVVQFHSNTMLAFLFSSVVFAAFHFVNDGWHPSMRYMEDTTLHVLPNGLICAALYVLGRNLWVAVGYHFAWDAVLIAVEGYKPAHLLPLIKGTVTGPEVGHTTLLITWLCAMILLCVSWRRGLWQRPAF